mgnify:FL=1
MAQLPGGSPGGAGPQSGTGAAAPWNRPGASPEPPAGAAGTGGAQGRAPNGQKKKPGSFEPDFLAIHGHPEGRSAEAPEQAWPNYNSPNVRYCQGFFSAPGNGAEKRPSQPKAGPVKNTGNTGGAPKGRPLQYDD